MDGKINIDNLRNDISPIFIHVAALKNKKTKLKDLLKHEKIDTNSYEQFTFLFCVNIVVFHDITMPEGTLL